MYCVALKIHHRSKFEQERRLPLRAFFAPSFISISRRLQLVIGRLLLFLAPFRILPRRCQSPIPAFHTQITQKDNEGAQLGNHTSPHHFLGSYGILIFERIDTTDQKVGRSSASNRYQWLCRELEVAISILAIIFIYLCVA